MKLALAILFIASLSFEAVADYSKHPEAEAFVDNLVTEHGFERAGVLSVLKQATQKESILKAISRPAEKTFTWAKYSKIFLTEKRIKNGKKFMNEFAEPLAKAEAEFGVPKEIITAIIGVETRYGGNKGSYRVVDALATLGFDYPPRSKFFKKEFTEMFLLAREQGFDPLELVGSYAGAMGFGQFISSSYRHYAVDFDGDDVADILNNPVDAIGSVANYFKEHRWKSGLPVARAIERKNASDEQMSFFDDFYQKSLKPKHTMAELRTAGFSDFSEVPDDASVRVLQLTGDHGQELWLTQHNFYVITRYNHSHLYAMAVFQLSEAFKEG